jgi:hypothetical protein
MQSIGVGCYVKFVSRDKAKEGVKLVPIRERLRLTGIAVFNPRRAAAEGLYDGRVLNAIWLNVIIIGWLVISVLFRRETIDLMRENSMVAASFIYAPFFFLIFDNWIAPRILSQCLSTKQKAMPYCRQIILFWMLFIFVMYIPYTIWWGFSPMPNWLANIWSIFVAIIGGYWMYIFMFPKHFDTCGKALKKVLIFGALSVLFAALLILIFAVIIIIFEFFGLI